MNKTNSPVNEQSARREGINLYLIKPSKYDDDGYVIRYWKGVLPSNTLACLFGLTQDLKEREVFGQNFQWHVEAIDETVQKVNVSKIIRCSKQKRSKTVICLAGVQSNQFPRAHDLAMEFKKAGLDVLIGGFHISGVLSTLRELPEDLLQLQEAGVSLVAGEVEGRWEAILRDAAEGNLKSIYNYLHAEPDLSAAPMPHVPQNLLNSYAVSHFATLDCGRGCPFQCSFCTVINVQGRRMRFRSVECIMAMLRRNYHDHKISHYFFTDDNFCRNKNWESIFDKLIQLREEEKIPLSFMIQVDTQSYKIVNFIEKAAKAGCSQAFIGMESINEDNLISAGKKQNRVENFKELIEAYQRVNIVTHVAYIIGFPFDNEASIARDMSRLQLELGAEQASFFMLTPLPGSMDYRDALSKRTIMDADLNNFDTFHETVQHSQMKGGSWTRAYENAWKTFYGLENMKRILKKASRKKYWDIFLNFIWYKNAVEVEGGHPMVHGFWRRKGRCDRRKCFPKESLVIYAKRRLLDIMRTFRGWIKLAFEMEEVWLATRHRSPLEEKVIEGLAKYKKQLGERRSLRLSELQMLYKEAANGLHLRAGIPSHFQLWIQRWNVFSGTLTFSRYPMKRFWRKMINRFKKRRLHPINFLHITFTGFREAILLARFFLALVRGGFSGAV